MKKLLLSAVALAALALPGSPVLAQSNEIVIGITVTTTGPAAALGIPERNSLDFVVKEIAGVPLKVIVLDDGGDATNPTTSALPSPITAERAKWPVSMPQPVPLMGKGLYAHMKAHNVKTVGYIGYS